MRAVIEANVRSLAIVAATSIIFAVLLWLADRSGTRRVNAVPFSELTVPGALFIGVAQAFALIPGTSRSGVTKTCLGCFNKSKTLKAICNSIHTKV